MNAISQLLHRTGREPGAMIPAGAEGPQRHAPSPARRRISGPAETGRKSDPHMRLLRGLQEIAGVHGRITESSSRPWASATFIGAQHAMTMRIGGPDALDRAARLAGALPDAEIRLAGHILADLVVDGVETGQDQAGAPFALLRLAALTVEDW